MPISLRYNEDHNYFRFKCLKCSNVKCYSVQELDWKFPCRVHYECTLCGEKATGNYSEHCDLAKRFKPQC